MKLLAIDMDGTLLNSKHTITEKTIEALKLAKEHGYEIVPTTGRSISCLPRQLKGTGIYRYVISSDGAEVYDTAKKRIIFSEKIPSEEAVEILEVCSKYKFAGITAHIGHDFVVQGKFLAKAGMFVFGEDVEKAIVVKDIVSYAKENNSEISAIQLFFFLPGGKRRVRSMLKKHSELTMAFSRTHVEIYSKNATKGNAVLALAEALNIPQEDTVCIGDATNDITMFVVCGKCFAMGNAIQELKEYANAVLPTNNEDGIAEAVKKYLI